MPYNALYNVSVVADLCGNQLQTTTQIKIHYGECNTYYACVYDLSLFIDNNTTACEEPLVSDINPQDHDNVLVLIVSGLGYGRPSLEGESARLSCPP